MRRIFTITLCTISLLFTACVDKDHESSQSQVIESSKELQYSGKKVQIQRNSRLYYTFNEKRQQPPIESFNSFFNWYTVDELSTVTEFVIYNYNPATGAAFPIVTTKGIERLLNVREIEIVRSGIKELDGIEKLSNLELLNLLENRLTQVSGIGKLENLRFLSLDANPIDSLNNVEASDYIESIAFDRTNITSFDGIERFPNLTFISANSNKLVDITAIESLKKLKWIEILSRDNNLNEASINLLKKMKQENPEMYVEWEIK